MISLVKAQTVYTNKTSVAQVGSYFTLKDKYREAFGFKKLKHPRRVQPFQPDLGDSLLLPIKGLFYTKHRKKTLRSFYDASNFHVWRVVILQSGEREQKPMHLCNLPWAAGPDADKNKPENPVLGLHL